MADGLRLQSGGKLLLLRSDSWYVAFRRHFSHRQNVEIICSWIPPSEILLERQLRGPVQIRRTTGSNVQLLRRDCHLHRLPWVVWPSRLHPPPPPQKNGQPT